MKFNLIIAIYTLTFQNISISGHLMMESRCKVPGVQQIRNFVAFCHRSGHYFDQQK